MQDAQQRQRLAFVGLSAFAGMLLAAGVVGLATPELVPALGKPSVAWSLIGVGVVLDLWAIGTLLTSARTDAARLQRGRARSDA